MRILLVASHYYPAFEYGGPVFSLHALCRAMRDKGVEVNVYTTNAYLEGAVAADKEVDVDGVKVTYFSYNKMFDSMGSNGWQYSPALTGSLKKNVKGFDLVYILGVWSYPALVAAYYSLKYHKPYFISPRGMLYPETMRKGSWKKALYFNILMKRYMQKADVVHYTSTDESQCHALLGLSNKALILPNGIDQSLFAELPGSHIFKQRYPVLQGKRVILFLGRLVWKKGLDILLEAYKEIARQRPNVHLVIAGGGEDRFSEGIRRLANDYGLNERVTFTGMLSGTQKLEAYSGSDLFVLPSYSENFGMTVVEAMCCGLPVVISDKVGIYTDIKNANAGIIVKCEKESVYDGMVSILDNPDLARRSAVNGAMLVRSNYDIRKIAESFIDSCTELI